MGMVGVWEEIAAPAALLRATGLAVSLSGGRAYSLPDSYGDESGGSELALSLIGQRSSSNGRSSAGSTACSSRAVCLCGQNAIERGSSTGDSCRREDRAGGFSDSGGEVGSGATQKQRTRSDRITDGVDEMKWGLMMCELVRLGDFHSQGYGNDRG